MNGKASFGVAALLVALLLLHPLAACAQMAQPVRTATHRCCHQSTPPPSTPETKCCTVSSAPTEPVTLAVNQTPVWGELPSTECAESNADHSERPSASIPQFSPPN